MMPALSKTVNAALIGCTAWLERPVLTLNEIKPSGLLKINRNTSLQETDFLSYSNHRRASNPTRKKQNMKNQVAWTGKNNSGIAVFVPRHSNGAPCAEDCISKAVANAKASGVEVSDGVTRKWSPSGASFNDGGSAFQTWLKNQGLELCKSDRSGAWWTVVKTADVTKRDKAGIAINSNNKFSYA